MSDRDERREEIKLILEYAKLTISIIGLGTLIFVGLQWMNSNRIATFTGYQRMATEWREHLITFVDKPDLRPYFEEGVQLADNDPNKETALALADVRLDVMDAVLTYPALLGHDQTEIEGWRNTFENAFRTSPVLCARLQETASNYGFIASLGAQACGR